MHRVLYVLIGCLFLLGACTKKLICPAYQSAFIYDQEALRKKFSYFNEDSTPKYVSVSKNRYLMIDEVSYRKKIKSMKTIEMKPVYTVLPDSLLKKDGDVVKGAEQDETAPADSSKTKPAGKEDSTYQITKDKEVRLWKYDRDSAKYHIQQVTFNAEQENYMWYFRDVLVLPDVRAALEDQKNAKANAAKEEKAKNKKPGIVGFFKNLFKKKEKVDSTKTNTEAPPPIDSDDPADSTAAVEPVAAVTPPPPEKKGVFGMFKKKKKKDKVIDKKPEDEKQPEPVVEPPKKETPKKEDGF